MTDLVPADRLFTSNDLEAPLVHNYALCESCDGKVFDLGDLNIPLDAVVVHVDCQLLELAVVRAEVRADIVRLKTECAEAFTTIEILASELAEARTLHQETMRKNSGIPSTVLADARPITYAWMAYLGYEAEEIAKAEAESRNHTMKCEFQGESWLCRDEDDRSYHPAADVMSDVAELVVFVLSQAESTLRRRMSNT